MCYVVSLYRALRAAGAIVPDNFNDFVTKVSDTYTSMVSSGAIVPAPDVPPPTMPMDYHWAQQLGLIRKPKSFVSTISDERGEELLYAGMPISKVFEEEIGVGGVVSLLWFRRRLPDYASKFIEMVLMVTADHGPAVSGAHNTIVTARYVGSCTGEVGGAVDSVEWWAVVIATCLGMVCGEGQGLRTYGIIGCCL